VVGIDPIRLSGPSTRRPGRPFHLHDRDPEQGQGPGNAGTVAGGTLHPHPIDHPLGGQELDGSGITGGAGGELGVPHHLADRGQHRDMNGVGVRINTADQLDSCCHDGTSLSARTMRSGVGWSGQTRH
jgi:hypothetical protein